MERLFDQVRRYEQVREIPREQRYLGRPALEEICLGGKVGDRRKRNKMIFRAVGDGYRRKKVAEHFDSHDSTVIRLVKEWD